MTAISDNETPPVNGEDPLLALLKTYRKQTFYPSANHSAFKTP
ncbi:MAG: hypothetical protein AAF234_06555 [Pseudomonadota bacterium]